MFHDIQSKNSPGKLQFYQY